MKLKIEKEFKDKFTGEKYEAGSEVDFEDARAKELLSDARGLVTKVKDEPKKPVKKSKK
jgi:hypothetical protein